MLLIDPEYFLHPFKPMLFSCFVVNMDFSTMSRGQITLLGSAGCVMLSMHFTVQLLSQHLFYWKNPKEQKAIIIIILMAPIYAIDSFVGLLDFQGSKAFFMLLESIKECYEALVSVFRPMYNLAVIRLLSVFTHQLTVNSSLCYLQVIAKFLALLYCYLNVSISKNIVPDGIKGREIHHSFPMTLFQVKRIYPVFISPWIN